MHRGRGPTFLSFLCQFIPAASSVSGGPLHGTVPRGLTVCSRTVDVQEGLTDSSVLGSGIVARVSMTFSPAVTLTTNPPNTPIFPP